MNWIEYIYGMKWQNTKWGKIIRIPALPVMVVFGFFMLILYGIRYFWRGILHFLFGNWEDI